ncbi:MAG: 1-acyl-sn-glycerol-3-phosphate acyltransferase [Candidatus Dependentiae bacterium]|nr:1-acyl-sn-glycerol-3-phosphate acyltransferase [Candidatus Dependentiae bacterium]
MADDDKKMIPIHGHRVNIFIHTLFSYLTVGCVVLTLVPPLLLLLLLPARIRTGNRLILALLDLFYRGVVGALFVPIDFVGRDAMPREPAIIVANHQSTIDIPIVGMLLARQPHVWFALSYYARMPVLGFFVRRLGFSLDRATSGSAAHDFLSGIRAVRSSSAQVIIFPEGTRYIDGRVHDFLEGFALIARHTNRPVVPIYMPDNYLVYPPASFWVYFHQLRVVVGPPFVRVEGESDELFTVRVHGWFEQQESAHRRGGQL